jgi:urea carboxylase-associated protein 1
VPPLDLILPAGAPWGGIVRRGEVLTLTDLEGGQAIDLLCYSADEPLERYSAPNTIKHARTLLLTTGHVLLSDVSRPLLTFVEDTAGGHDTIGGCCSAASNELLYGVAGVPGCRENLLAAIEPFGLGRRDLVPNLNVNCRVPVQPGNSLLERTFAPPTSRAGDRVAFRAEMDCIVALSNCPQVLNPANEGHPTPVRIQIDAVD